MVESALQWSSWLNGAALPFTRSLKMLLPSSRENNHFPRCGFGRSWTTSTRAWAQKVCSPHPCSMSVDWHFWHCGSSVDALCSGVVCKSHSAVAPIIIFRGASPPSCSSGGVAVSHLLIFARVWKGNLHAVVPSRLLFVILPYKGGCHATHSRATKPSYSFDQTVD